MKNKKQYFFVRGRVTRFEIRKEDNISRNARIINDTY